MTDIARKCTKCGAETTVSEAAERFKCPGCGTLVSLLQTEEAKAEGKKTPSARARLRVREEVGAKLDGLAPEPRRGLLERKPKPIPTRPRERDGRSAMISPHHIGSWILFFVLGGCMAGCRYGGWLDSFQLETLRIASPIILLVLYLMTLLTVFKDSIFAGILSLLIPPYALYYLLTASDRFMLRGVVFGMLVGIGQYSVEFLTVEWANVVEAVQAYIASGG
jgi:predicted RNA-binding Zn-ribbon protein involved in translation (DUF1610 family)